MGLTKATRCAGRWDPSRGVTRTPPGREGLSKEVICSLQQSATVLGTRCSAVSQTQGTPALRELNSRWGASVERRQMDNKGACGISDGNMW